MSSQPIIGKPAHSRAVKPARSAHVSPKLGRPTIFSQQLADEICERLVKPESMRSICLDDHMPDRSTIARWMANDAHFAAMVAYARELQAEALIDEAMDIADNPAGDFVVKPDGTPIPVWEAVQRAKLRCDMRRWYAAKLAPKRFGETVTQKLAGKDEGPVEFKDVSEEARLEAFMAFLQKTKGQLLDKAEVAKTIAPGLGTNGAVPR
jgi:hypothetical protein